MALTIFFFVCDLCGLPFGVFLAFYDERLQSGLGLASFLCLCIFLSSENPNPGGSAELCLRLGVAASRLCCGLWYVLCGHRPGGGFFGSCRLLFYLDLEVCLDARRPP